MNKAVFILFLFLPACVFGQNTIRGKVLRAADNNPVFGANIYLKGHPTTGTATNLKGRFVLAIPKKFNPIRLLFPALHTIKEPYRFLQFNGTS